jgi:hydrogenase maturation protease
MTGRILVAGVGNVFLRDDAFGVEVVRLLAERPQPPGVQVRDYGIRGVHLAYELLNGYDLFVLVDAAPRGEAPGTVTVLEVDLPGPDALPVIDAHSLTPDAIFGLLSSLGGHPGRSLVVACEPAEVDAGMGLSDPVREALPHAVRVVEELVAQADETGPHGHEQRADEQECMADLARHPDGPRLRKEVLGMLSRLIKAVVIAAVLALVVDSLPDIKRYLEIREM